jgi:hypothetical protein
MSSTVRGSLGDFTVTFLSITTGAMLSHAGCSAKYGTSKTIVVMEVLRRARMNTGSDVCLWMVKLSGVHVASAELAGS